MNNLRRWFCLLHKDTVAVGSQISEGCDIYELVPVGRSLADDPAAVDRACIRQHGAEAWARWTDSAKSYRSVLLGEMAEVLRAAEKEEG